MRSRNVLLITVACLMTGCESDVLITRDGRDDDDIYVRREVVVARPLPPARVERVVASPNPNYVWIKGHWAWRDNDWVWVRGRWAERPRPGAVWVEGTFLRRGNEMVWNEGHWSNQWVTRYRIR